MPLKVYKKNPIKVYSEPLYPRDAYFNPKRSESISTWAFFKSMYNDFLDYMSVSRVASLVIPVSLIISGGYILYLQLWPEVEQAILQYEGYFDQGTTPLVAGDYVEDRQIYLSNPGAEYFKQLSDTAYVNDPQVEDTVSKNYNGTFSISLPSLGLIDVPVTANVNSGSKEVYDSVLKSTLAHFEGTGLPLSTVDQNIVVYGHSANGNYYERTQDPAGAFSRLQKIKIGDEISITMEGKEYKFKVNKTQIVNPDEISIVTGTKNKRTLTLFTCFPNGNPAKRFVVVARPV